MRNGKVSGPAVRRVVANHAGVRSTAASFLNGDSFTMDGGRTAR